MQDVVTNTIVGIGKPISKKCLSPRSSSIKIVGILLMNRLTLSLAQTSITVIQGRPYEKVLREKILIPIQT